MARYPLKGARGPILSIKNKHYDLIKIKIFLMAR
jgi:hypothetical protein